MTVSQASPYKLLNGYKTVSHNESFRFKSLCPYCGSDLTYRCTGWIEDDYGQMMANELEVYCHSMPNFEDPKLENWLSQHSEMPYVHQLPINMKVAKFINKRFRFDLQ